MLPAQDIWIRLGVAMVAGALVGLEREIRRQQAGIRTYAIIAIGAAVFTMTSVAFGHDSDPSRLAAQVASGIGFIGGGMILKEGATVRGLTTAATVFAVAAIGVASGIGYLSLVIPATILIELTLVLRPFTRALSRGTAPRVAVHGTGKNLSSEISTVLASFGITEATTDLTLDAEGAVVVILSRLRPPPTLRMAELTAELSQLSGVTRVQSMGFRKLRGLGHSSGRHKGAAMSKSERRPRG